MGVIHITTDPGGILRELHRVLKPGQLGRVMVYNTDSVWFVYTAYVKQIVEGRWTDLPVEEAFQEDDRRREAVRSHGLHAGGARRACESAGSTSPTRAATSRVWELSHPRDAREERACRPPAGRAARGLPSRARVRLGRLPGLERQARRGRRRLRAARLALRSRLRSRISARRRSSTSQLSSSLARSTAAR